MSIIQTQLRSAYRRLAHRPVPRAWVDRHSQLATHTYVSDLVDAIRDLDHPSGADPVVRALARLAPTDPDAATVLLEALVWPVRARLGRNCSPEFRDDVLTDLAIVVLEAEDLDQLDRLPRRLTRRAYARARRRAEAEQALLRRHAPIDAAGEAAVAGDDVAEVATDRARLAAAVATIAAHVEAGRITPQAWEDWRDGYLAPEAGWWRRQPNRTRTYRARRAIEPVLAHAS